MDKLLHFFICMCVVLTGWALLPAGGWSIAFACIAALGLGIAKEIFDYTSVGSIKGVDYKDIIADVLGIVGGLAVILLNQMLY